MEIQPVSTPTTPHSPSSSSSTSSTLSSHRRNPNPNSNPNKSNNNSSSDANPVQSWWESISKARSRIQSLSSFLPSTTTSAAASVSFSISSLADSDRPALALLESPDAYVAVSAFLSRPASGSGDDPLCQWLYETYQSADTDLRLVVLSFLPLLSGLYLSRVIAGGTQSLAGFEAVLLSIYAAETKVRAGKPVTISIPDLSQPSLYHTPKQNNPTGSRQQQQQQQVSSGPVVGVVCPPLEPQIAVKSTKRACIVGVALDCYYKKISLMPSRSKLDFCDFAAAWAGQDCSCRYELDQGAILNTNSSDSTCSDVRVFSEDEEVAIWKNTEDMGKLTIEDSPVRQMNGENGEVVESSSSSGSRRGTRIPLPWELLQPMLKILGHCLLGPLNTQDVRDAAAASVRSIYARASHDLIPQAILASRSLIQLDKSSRASGKEMALATSSASNPNTPSKPRKPEVFLVSK